MKRKTINNSFDYAKASDGGLSDVGDMGAAAKQDGGANPFEPTEAADRKCTVTELQFADKQTACGTFISAELRKFLPPLPVGASSCTQQRNASQSFLNCNSTYSAKFVTTTNSSLSARKNRGGGKRLTRRDQQ